MLPDGVSLGRLQGPLGGLASISPGFTGAVRISGSGGVGFVLLQGGDPYAAAFEATGESQPLNGYEAYRYLLDQPMLAYELIAYTSGETGIARAVSEKAGCLMGEGGVGPAVPLSPDAGYLERIARQPGVIAVSAFHEVCPPVAG